MCAQSSKDVNRKVNYPNLIGSPLDYSKEENWLIKLDNKKKVDVFYFYPTAVEVTYPEEIGTINETVKSNAIIGYQKAVSCFREYTNVFVPLYRQMSFFAASKIRYYEGYLDRIYRSVVRTDIYAALDYFFEHINNGRPFILAGISQGGYCIQIILSEYMNLHPEYYSRMIASYCGGTSFSQKYIRNNPHVKMATGELDLGVVIAWNSEAPNGTLYNMLIESDSYCINPLNWKTDDTYAPASLNKGTLNVKTGEIIPGIIDAQIDLNRHVIVVTTAKDHGYQPLPLELGAGDKSYHFNEWDFFYANIKENGKKRIDKYFEKELKK